MEVEALAERFLTHLAPRALHSPRHTPLVEIVDTLHQRGYLTIDLQAPLGHTSEGYLLLGSYDVVGRRISIAANLSDDDLRFPFTLAHELGHFYLHSKINVEALLGAGIGVIRDSTRELVVHRVDASRPRSLLEWQANRFAASILVPRATLPDAVVQVQKEMGITRNLGIVWVDQQKSSRRDYREVVARLTTIYNTSQSVLRYRLAELRLSREHSSSGWPIKLGDLMGDALSDVFLKGAPDSKA